MREKIFEIFESQIELSMTDIMMNIIMSAFFGILIFISYYTTHRGTIYSKKFNASLVILTVLTATVMTVIGNNLALSLGMVGALSIVRFRTAIKDSRDTIYIFWTIIAGICCGVGDYIVAGVGSAVAFIVFLLFGFIKSDNRMLIIIRAARSCQNPIQAYMYKTFKRMAILRVRNTTEDTVEFIYEISAKALKKADENDIDYINSIYEMGSVEYVNIVMQNDEISN